MAQQGTVPPRTAADVAAWEADVARLSAEHDALVRDGRWVVGVDDILSIIGHSRLESDYSKLLLYRPAWHPQNSRHEASIPPRIGVGIEWRRKDVTFAGHQSSAYTGVWVDCREGAGRQFSGEIARALRQAGLPMEQRASWSKPWWVTDRWEPARGEYWDGLSLYRQQLVDSVRDCWRAYEPTIDGLVA